MPKSQSQKSQSKSNSQSQAQVQFQDQAQSQAKPLKYNHRTVEKKWQKKWQEENLYRTSESKDKPKYYVLDMFPYPSGAGLHVGHPKGYIATDIFARMKTMQGYNVLHPMGWDAFGLPAENFALKNKVHPRVSNDKNIKTFKKQLGKLGFSYDWEREISTTDPEFYKWTQWIFLQLYKKGLAYVSHEPINWCPSCQTGLANEDLEGGKCERCGSDIERKPMQQWVLKITDYAERMLQDLDKLPEWEESIKEMQKNWIGKSEGAEVKFQVLNSKFQNPPSPEEAAARPGSSKDSISSTKKVYFATGNKNKLERFEKIFKEIYPDIKIERVPELIEIEEDGKDALENSLKKAKAYEGKYDVPVICYDTAIHFDNEDFDPTKIKRIYLDGRPESEFSQEEIREKILNFYKGLARKAGGEKGFYFEDGHTVIMPSGEIRQSRSMREYVLTDQERGEKMLYFPIRNLYKSKITGKYAIEHNEEEFFEEFEPQIEALKDLFGAPNNQITVFTTRPDTLWGATYMVMAPEHEMLEVWRGEIKNWKAVSEYIEKAKNKSDLERQESKEKTGVKLDGVTAKNPVNGEQLPIFVADYVLAGYGTGAIMAVPAHDERDWEFAKKFDLPIRQVVAPLFEASKDGKEDDQHAVREDKETVDRRVVYGLVKDPKTGKYLMINWKVYDQTKTWVIGGVEEGESLEEAARREIEEETGYYDLEFKGQLGGEIHKKFFAKHKDENRYGRSRCAYFELKSDQQKELDFKEEAKHTPGWYSKKEVDKLLTFSHQQYFWKVLQGQEPECFVGEGVAINSDILNDLKTPEAKEKVIQWLEEQGLGKRAINYKIKDWVFSRQRYWGEPIPIVWCRQCALQPKTKNQKLKTKVLMIHGFGVSSQDNWFSWMKKELEKIGCEVFVPEMPNSSHPKLEEWLESLQPALEKLDENSVIIGHSLGSKAALHAIEKAGVKINQVFLVASALGDTKRDWEKIAKKHPDWDIERLKAFWEEELNWEKVDQLAQEKYAIISKDDRSINCDNYQFKKLSDVQVETWEGFGHFIESQIPKLRDYLVEKIKAGVKPVPVPVPEDQLPVKLPEVKHYEPTGTGESPLAGIESWVNTKCPVCGGPARRETNTMPQWAGSSWYYLRFIDPHNNEALVDKQKEKYWSPVDFYVGGAEHATRHLIYARFWHKFLYDIGAVNYPEPFTRLQHVGLILAEDGRKMSKRWGNVINPDDIVEEFGADAMRVYEMFMGPFSQACAWSTNGLIGSRKFLEKVVKISNEVLKDSKASEAETGPETERLLHQTIKKVGEDIEQFKLNTAISQMMILVNKISEEGISQADWTKFVQILSPFAPHLAEELWERLGYPDSIFKQSWPKFDSNKLKEDTFELVVQVNGKLRARITVPRDIDQAQAQDLAQKEDRVQKFLQGKGVRKVIFVPGKLVNLVV